MKHLLPTLFLLVGWSLEGAALGIDYQTTLLDSATNKYRYTYSVTSGGIPNGFLLEILFPVLNFMSIENGNALGFDLLLFPVDNPPGSTGVYSALAQSNIGVGTQFSVEAVMKSGSTPVSQTWNLYDTEDGIMNGTTTSRTSEPPPGGNVIPEPGTWMTLSAGALACWMMRKK